MNDMWLRADDGAAHQPVTASTPCIKIDKGVPMPPKFMGVGRPRGFGLMATAAERMEVGDSFIYPAAAKGLQATQRRASAWVANWKRPKNVARGKVFDVRTVMEGGERVVRIWRTA